jgi:ketosteroid isomerase-like protein
MPNWHSQALRIRALTHDRLDIGHLAHKTDRANASFHPVKDNRNAEPKIFSLPARQTLLRPGPERSGRPVDGGHFFEIVADDVIYEVLYDLGWPRVIRGRTDLMAAFRDYVKNIALQSADKLITHKTEDGCVIEYEVHGTILATGVKYDNRFCAVIKIENRKITHWRDCTDYLVAWKALVPDASWASFLQGRVWPAGRRPVIPPSERRIFPEDAD